MIFQNKLPGKIKGIKLLSIDLFDTLVTRSFAHPADLFYDLEKTIKNFADARIKSEYQLREEQGFKQEVTLDEIYNRLRTNLGLSETQANRFREMEMELEEQCILSIEPVAEALKEIKKILKIKVIMISDTYLPEAFIVKILKKHRLSGLFDRLYISSTHSVQKSTGSMFRFVKEAENIPVKKWLHIGDNEVSDYKIPRKMGIRTHRFQDAHLTRYEKSFAPAPGFSGRHSTFAALLRQVRLDCPYTKDSEKIIWDTTIDVSAPLMIAYVRWCLAKAEANGVKRVYFLSRDGQVLFKIAGILNRFSPSPLDIRYLYVSRQSLLFPAMQGIDKESLEWILLPTSLVTPRIILKRINVEPEEIRPILKKYGYFNADKALSKNDLYNFKSVLQDREVRSLVYRRIKVYRENTLGYLQQEGLTKDGKFALVDIGWNGTLQRSISRLLEMKGKNFPIKGLYFGLRRVLKHKDSDKSETFFFSPEKSQGLEKETHIIPIIEMFTAAVHGGVVRHKFENFKYKPVLQNSENTPGVHWGVKVQHRAMEILSEKIAENSINLGEIKNIIFKNPRLFIIDPSHHEARTFGAFEIAEDQNEAFSFPLAEKYTFFQLFRHYRYGFMHHHNEWKEAARRLSGGLFGRYLWRRFSKSSNL